jgi:hypothetical protein
MDQQLKDLIETAKEELRKKSGVPLTDHEKTDDRRLAESETAFEWLWKTFTPELMFPLDATVVWQDNEAVSQFTVDGRVFDLLKDAESYRLVLDGETLITLKADDPDLANKVLVAIGGVVEGLKAGIGRLI